MPDFDILASTTRAGVAIDEIEFAISGAPPATAYLLGRRPGEVQPVVLGFHDERGDKATLLPDLTHLAGRGFLCLSIDSPRTRTAIAERNHLAAFESQFWGGVTALNLMQGDAEAVDHRVALLGRGIGGEVAGAIASHTFRAQVVVAFAALPSRAQFLGESDHPIAAGVRQFAGSEVGEQIEGLGPRQLINQLERAPETHWLLQVGTDDDRLSPSDHDTLMMSIPRAVRVARHRSVSDLTTATARRERVDFISTLCG